MSFKKLLDVKVKKDDQLGEIGYGIGLAIGIVLNIALNLFLLWLGLWVLTQFNWLPFVV